MVRRPKMSRRIGLHRMAWALAAVLVGLLATAAGAAEPPGSANFTPPGSVPDYFSNESGAVRGASPARPEAAVAAPAMRAAEPRHHASSRTPHARARHRARLSRGRHGHDAAVHAGKTRRGKAARQHVARRDRGGRGAKHAAARHAAAGAKPKRPARAHG